MKRKRIKVILADSRIHSGSEQEMEETECKQRETG